MIKKSLAAWSSIANIKFKRSSSGSADITLSFQPKSHSADGEYLNMFGESTLAHAILPGSVVYVHFYDKWNWALQRGKGTALLEVTAHELGHNLGLSHSYGRDDLMYAYTRNQDFTSVTFSSTYSRKV